MLHQYITTRPSQADIVKIEHLSWYLLSLRNYQERLLFDINFTNRAGQNSISLLIESHLPMKFKQRFLRSILNTKDNSGASLLSDGNNSSILCKAILLQDTTILELLMCARAKDGSYFINPNALIRNSCQNTFEYASSIYNTNARQSVLAALSLRQSSIAEIKKNSHITYRASYYKGKLRPSLFIKLSDDLIEEICSYTGDHRIQTEKEAKKIVRDTYCQLGS